MPELPEVETVVNGIRSHVTNKTIQSVWTSGFRLRCSNQDDLSDQLMGSSITGVSRRAKYIALHLSSNIDTVIHLGMSGKLLIEGNNYQSKKHDHVVITLSDNSKLVFNDARRFGMFFWHDDIHQYLKHYGVEPLSDSFNTAYLSLICQNKQISIKQLIMDQKYVVGVGNIYACEALFKSQILPTKAARHLSEAELTLLVSWVKKILIAAIHKGGTTLKDYRTANDTLGYFQQKLSVYGREGEPCYECGGWIQNKKMSSRSTFYCKECQQ